MEDLGAHSNWVELALIELGYRDVFPHVGRNTQIQVQGKRVWPLVTGTFGGTDFIHSLLGEATDKISQVSLIDLNSAVSDAGTKDNTDTFRNLKQLLSIFPSGQSDLDKMQSESSENRYQKLHILGTKGEGQ